jgi:hypothetical protein
MRAWRGTSSSATSHLIVSEPKMALESVLGGSVAVSSACRNGLAAMNSE